MIFRHHVSSALLALACCHLSATSTRGEETTAQTDPAVLTLARIYEKPEFSAKGYAARWLEDGAAYTRLEASAQTPGGKDIVRYEAESGERTVIVPAAVLIPDDESAPLTIENYQFSADLAWVLIHTNSERVWRRRTRGDYWVLDRSGRQVWQLAPDAQPSTLMFAKFSPNSRHVAYVRDRDIYVQDLRDRRIRRLTEKPSPRVINGTFDWVYEEELSLRDGFRWSPDGRRIAYWQLDTTDVPEFAMINNVDSRYPRVIRFAYPKTGQTNSACRVGVVDVDGSDTRWLDVPGDPRDHYIARMEWAENSRRIVLRQLNRLQNTNRVMLADADTGAVREVFTERDDAWVDVHDEMFWLDDGQRFTWISERDGWRHAYLISRTGESRRLLTPGSFDVMELLHVDAGQGECYFLASPENPTQRYLYRANLDGSGARRVTPADMAGWHDYRISPNGRWAVHTRSSFDHPPVTDLARLPDHESVRVLEDNQKLHDKVQQLRREFVEFFRVDIGDGVELDGWCLTPPDLDPSSKYPLLVYVYGEPAGATVVDRWGGGGYLWHLMLAQRGYVVMSFDNRGTRAFRGRDWRKSIYRRVGVLAPQDQAAAVRAVLRQRPYLDADRVGVWGWSGGGSMSLNAIFKYPELYQTAIAVAPVPNQRYYDTIYQERYMGLPNDNVDGYLAGSPINFADQLQGNLLLIHGTGDDNCHYQTTEMLINELIRHNKPFTMMAYPNRTHAIREGQNTTLHLRALMTRYLETHLPAGPVDQPASRSDSASRSDDD